MVKGHSGTDSLPPSPPRRRGSRAANAQPRRRWPWIPAFAGLTIAGAAAAVALLMIGGGAEAGEARPEGGPGQEVRAAVEAKSFLVVAANPLAAKAGAAIIREGGSAVDAAVAVQMVLNFNK